MKQRYVAENFVNALRQGDTELAKKLLCQLNPNTTYQDQSLLYHACSEKNYTIVCHLIEKGVNVDVNALCVSCDDEKIFEYVINSISFYEKIVAVMHIIKKDDINSFIKITPPNQYNSLLGTALEGSSPKIVKHLVHELLFNHYVCNKEILLCVFRYAAYRGDVSYLNRVMKIIHPKNKLVIEAFHHCLDDFMGIASKKCIEVILSCGIINNVTNYEDYEDDVVDIIKNFNANPLRTRKKFAEKYGVISWEAQIFVIVSSVVDGYFTSKNKFIQIASRLNEDTLQVLINRMFGSGQNIIPLRDISLCISKN